MSLVAFNNVIVKSECTDLQISVNLCNLQAAQPSRMLHTSCLFGRHLRGRFLLRILFYHDATDVNDPEARELAALRIIAKMPTLAAIAYKTSVGVRKA